jgi:hypothetical protein
VPPVRRSHIYKQTSRTDRRKKTNVTAYPQRLVQTSTNDMNLVELQTGYGTRMPQQCPMSLARPHYITKRVKNLRHTICIISLTVPHSYHTVPATADETITPELNTADKVLVHIPASICIRGCWDGKRSSGNSGCTRKEVAREWDTRDCHRWVRNRPQYVHGHYTLACCKVPLPKCLIRSPGDLRVSRIADQFCV